jgi:transposase
MSSDEIPDVLWTTIEKLLPESPPRPKGGRPRVPDRAALGGIIFVLRTGIQWAELRKELGFGSGSTCWRRLQEWQEAGVWEQLHYDLLWQLQAVGQIDWSRVCVDASSIAAKRGVMRPAPIPQIAGGPGQSGI